jgi:hypothetical protein
MPGLVRKILIFAAVDGLVLQPLAQRGQRPAPAAKIAYKDNSIGPVLNDEGDGESPGIGFEAFGIVGMYAERFAVGPTWYATTCSMRMIARLVVERSTPLLFSIAVFGRLSEWLYANFVLRRFILCF